MAEKALALSQDGQARLLKQLRNEYDAGIQYRQGRSKAWKLIEDHYYGRVKAGLPGRFNVPFPVMAGFIDTWVSKVDDAPYLRFEPRTEAYYRTNKKVEALWESVASPNDGFDIESVDLGAKKLAAMSGRAIYKAYGESVDGFKFRTETVDHYDFSCDPMGGGIFERHNFAHQDNIWKSADDLGEGADSGFYDKRSVAMLSASMGSDETKQEGGMYKNRSTRLEALGLPGDTYNYRGEACDEFIESVTRWGGRRYHVIWTYRKGVILRAVPLVEDFRSDLMPWTSWAVKFDPPNFWSPGPADDMVAVAEVIRILLNQELDNRQKQNWGQRAYDPDVFPNGSELEWRPNGLVTVRTGLTQTRQIGTGIYEFQTPQLGGTINLVQWLDSFTGQKTGVTAATQGNAEDAKVGIYQGNMQQVADRFGLYNKNYVKCYADIGRRFLWAAHEHITGKEAVRIIGEKGVQWEYLKGREVDPTVSVLVKSSATEMQVGQMKKDRKAQALEKIYANPKLVDQVNRKWLVENILVAGDFDDAEIRNAQDLGNDGSREVMARAAEAIEDILSGKSPKLFRGATTGFQQKILDFALDNTDDDLKLYLKLTEYASAHDQIVMENTARKAASAAVKAGAAGPGAPSPATAEPPQEAMQDVPQEAPPGVPEGLENILVS